MWMLTTELGAIPSWQPAHFVPYFRKKSSRQNTSLMERRVEVSWCLFRWKRDLFLTKHFSRRGCAQEAQLRHFACQGWSTTFDKSVFKMELKLQMWQQDFYHFGLLSFLFAIASLSFTNSLSGDNRGFKRMPAIEATGCTDTKRLKMRKVDLPWE